MKKYLIAAGIVALSAGVVSAQQSPTANAPHKGATHAHDTPPSGGKGETTTPAPTPTPTPTPTSSATPTPTPSPAPTTPVPVGPTE